MPDDIDRVAEPQTFAELPIQPTGSGVKDLEMAYEQMKLSSETVSGGDETVEADVPDGASVPTESSDAAADSEAHPS